MGRSRYFEVRRNWAFKRLSSRLNPMTKKEVAKLDKIAELKCKENAGWKCEVCGKSKAQGYQMHWHHYIGRRLHSLRWTLDNLFCVCAGCHKLSHWSFHENPEWGRKTFIDLRGKKLLDELQTLSHKINKFTFDQNQFLIDKPAKEIIKFYSKPFFNPKTS